MIKMKSIKKPARVLLSVLLILALLPVSSAAAMGAAVIDREETVSEMFYVEYWPGGSGEGYYIEYVEAGTVYTIKTPEECNIIEHGWFMHWEDIETYEWYYPGDTIEIEGNISFNAVWLR